MHLLNRDFSPHTAAKIVKLFHIRKFLIFFCLFVEKGLPKRQSYQQKQEKESIILLSQKSLLSLHSEYKYHFRNEGKSFIDKEDKEV